MPAVEVISRKIVNQTNQNNSPREGNLEIPLDLDKICRSLINAIENRLARVKHRVILVEERVFHRPQSKGT